MSKAGFTDSERQTAWGTMGILQVLEFGLALHSFGESLRKQSFALDSMLLGSGHNYVVGSLNISYLDC